jgi:hypothetical protein
MKKNVVIQLMNQSDRKLRECNETIRRMKLIVGGLNRSWNILETNIAHQTETPLLLTQPLAQTSKTAKEYNTEGLPCREGQVNAWSHHTLTMMRRLELAQNVNQLIVNIRAEFDDKQWLENVLEVSNIYDDQCAWNTLANRIEGLKSKCREWRSLRPCIEAALVEKLRCTHSGRYHPTRPCSNLFMLRKAFNEMADEEQVVLGIFHQIDPRSSRSVSKSALYSFLDKQELGGVSNQFKPAEQSLQALPQIPEPVLALKVEIERNCPPRSDSGIDLISIDDVIQAMAVLPRARGERVRWAAGLGLDAELARLLAKGSIFDGLSGLKSLDGPSLEQHIMEVCSSFITVLPRLLRNGIFKLKRSGAGNEVQRHINSKFLMDGAYLGRFGLAPQYTTDSLSPFCSIINQAS